MSAMAILQEVFARKPDYSPETALRDDISRQRLSYTLWKFSGMGFTWLATRL
jgi:hypothetical protein